MLDIYNTHLLIKTTYPARRSEESLLSIASSCSLLNAAFHNTYIVDSKKAVYCNVIEKLGVTYLLVSTKKLRNFYKFNRVNAVGYQASAVGFRKYFGKIRKVRRYSLEEVTCNGKNIRAFALSLVAQDNFVGEIADDFEVIKKKWLI